MNLEKRFVLEALNELLKARVHLREIGRDEQAESLTALIDDLKEEIKA